MVKLIKTIPITKARQDLYNLVDEATQSNQPIQILGRRGDAVLVSLDDWNAMQETLYLVSMPNMREDLLEGKNTVISECMEDIGWDTN